MPTAELRSLSLADIMPPSAYHQPNPRRNVLLVESRVRHGVLSAHTALPQDYVNIAARVYDNDNPRHQRRRRVACNHVRLDSVFPDTWLARDAVLFATPVGRRQYPSSPSWLQARRQPGTVAHARSEENASAWRNNGEPELSSPPNKWCGHTGSCLCPSLRSRLRLRPPTLLVDPAPIPQPATAPPADAVTFSEAPFIGTDADWPTAATAAQGNPNLGLLHPDWPGHNPAPWASWAPVPPPAHVAVSEVVQPQIEGRAPAPSPRSAPRALAPNDTPNAPCTLAPDATGTAHPSSAPCGSVLRLRGGTGTVPHLPSAANPLASSVTRLLARPSLAATYARAEAVQREPIVLSPMTSDTASQELASLLSCVLDAPATYDDAAGGNVIDRVAAAVVDTEGQSAPSWAPLPSSPLFLRDPTRRAEFVHATSAAPNHATELQTLTGALTMSLWASHHRRRCHQQPVSRDVAYWRRSCGPRQRRRRYHTCSPLNPRATLVTPHPTFDGSGIATRAVCDRPGHVVKRRPRVRAVRHSRANAPEVRSPPLASRPLRERVSGRVSNLTRRGHLGPPAHKLPPRQRQRHTPNQWYRRRRR